MNTKMNNPTHVVHMQILREESQKIITQLQQRLRASLAHHSSQLAFDAYEQVMQSLSRIPETINNEITYAYEMFGSNGLGGGSLLEKKLGYIKKSIDRHISSATIELSTIEYVGKNGVDVSPFLQSIQGYSDNIKIECEKLFQNKE